MGDEQQHVTLVVAQVGQRAGEGPPAGLRIDPGVDVAEAGVPLDERVRTESRVGPVAANLAAPVLGEEVGRDAESQAR